MKSDLYLKWDLYSRDNDRTFKKYCRTFPGVGFEVFVETAIDLTKNEGNPIERDDLIDDLRDTTHIERTLIENCIDYACDVALLKRTDAGEIFSTRVQRDIEEGKRLSEKRRSSAKGRWGEQMESKCNANAEQMQSDCNATKTNTKNKTNTNTNTKNNKSNRFEKPSLDELERYCRDQNLVVDVSLFLDYYESNGWMVGKSHMKDWRATLRNWSRRQISDRKRNIPTDLNGQYANELIEEISEL